MWSIKKENAMCSFVHMKQLKNHSKHKIIKHNWILWVWEERDYGAGVYFLISLSFLEKKKEDNFKNA